MSTLFPSHEKNENCKVGSINLGQMRSGRSAAKNLSLKTGLCLKNGAVLCPVMQQYSRLLSRALQSNSTQQAGFEILFKMR